MNFGGKRKSPPPKKKVEAADPEPIATQAELAGLLDRNKGQVTRWVKDDRWPFPRVPPWPRAMLPQILRWVAEELRSKGEKEGEPLTETARLRLEKLKAEVRGMTARAECYETELAQTRGLLVKSQQVEKEWASIAATIRNGFQSLPAELVPIALRLGMPGSNAAAFQAEAATRINQTLAALSRDVESDDA